MSASGTLPAQKFTGQRLDGTGLYYYGARYYDPALARFVSADTIVPRPANPQSLNRYSYTLNNPLKYVDPTGHLVEGSIPWRFPGSTEQVWVSSSMLSIPGWAAANP
ncbi:MAG: RHS repeat-associated core domain-containing protein, partial [Chloroflexi bacterium]|nr:RHS repeat-associated core domain-containing protein [Chloroflexota bacterium]